MIFVTVGTERFPFNRLLTTLDEACQGGIITSAIFAQIGTSTYVPRRFDHCRFMPYEQVLHHMHGASIVVAHAGVGSVLLALELGKTPILLPRRKEFGEQIDDHQVEFAIRLEGDGIVQVAHDEDQLIHKIVECSRQAYAPKAKKYERVNCNLVSFLEKIVRE